MILGESHALGSSCFKVLFQVLHSSFPASAAVTSARTLRLRMVQGWRPWLLPAVGIFYVVVLAVTIPVSVVHLVREHAEKHVVAWFVAGLFVLITIPISLFDIGHHLVHYTQPDLQRYYIRIIWMVPVYSLDSWLALRFPGQAVYFDTARECYEAYVIYNFMQMLLTFLKKQHQHPEHFVRLCTSGVLQYTLVRVLTTVIAFICELTGHSQVGKYQSGNAWLYLMIINNASQFWAMYCLILFYYATKLQLKPLDPLPKFLCVKLVVFFSFWQNVLISLIGALGGIPHNSQWTTYRTTKDVATSIQDFVICIEMFLAAIAHHYAFSYKPYIVEDVEIPSCCLNCLHSSSVSDVREDIASHTQYALSRIRIRTAVADETSRLIELQPTRPQPTSEEMVNSNNDQ